MAPKSLLLLALLVLSSSSLPTSLATPGKVVVGRLQYFACEDTNCTAAKPTKDIGPFAAGKCCKFGGSDEPPCGAEFNVNGTLSLNSVGGCNMTDSAWRIPAADGCIPFMIPPTVCFHMRVVKQVEDSGGQECPPSPTEHAAVSELMALRESA